MNISKLLNGKFSIVLTLALTFIVLTTSVVAQSKNGFASNQINRVNSGASETERSSANRPHSGGVNFLMGDGSVRFSVAVLEVVLPNSPLEYDRVDAQDPNAAVKIRMLFEAAERMRSAVVLSVPKSSVNIAGKFRQSILTVSDGGENRMQIKMKDVLVSSYNHSSSSASMIDQFSLNFEKIRID